MGARFPSGLSSAAAPAMGPTLEAVLADTNVRSAWERVRRNRGCAGIDSVGLAELEPVFAGEWRQVAVRIRSGEYVPRPLLRVAIPKPDGGERRLAIPSVIDRVVQQSVAQVLSPVFEREFSPRRRTTITVPHDDN